MSVSWRVWRALDYKVCVLLLLLLLSAAGVCAPMALGWFVNALESGDGRETLYLGLFGLCEIIGIGLEYARLRCVSVSIALAENRLREQAFSKLLELPLDQMLASHKGTWVGRLCNDTSAICGALQGFWQQLASFAIFLVMTAVFIFVRVPVLMLLFALVMAAGVVTYAMFKRRLERAAMKLRKISYRFYDWIFDICGLLPIIRAHGCSAAFVRLFSSLSAAYSNQDAKTKKTSDGFAATFGVEVLAVHLVVLGLCVVCYRNGMIQVGEIVAYDMLLMKVVNGINGLMQQMPLFERGRESAKALDGWMNEQGCPVRSDADEVGGMGNDGEQGAAIMLDRVWYAYPDAKKPVLKNVSLEIKNGEYVCLVGRNGSGKSTLVGLMLGIFKPFRGRCSVVASNPSFVPQTAVVLKGSILENVRLYASGISRGAVESVLQLCGLKEWLVQQNAGVDSMVDGDRMSGGEKQRLCIARALVRRPDLLIVDETTNNLDIVEKKRIAEILRSLRRKCTIVSITHDDSFLHECDKVYEVKDGSVTQLTSNEAQFGDLPTVITSSKGE